MSYLLAIDTCTRHTSIALRDLTSLRAELTWECERHHTAAVTARIRQMLDECGVKAQQLSAVAVALGPGSFTGVRCGLAIAKGMALASGVEGVPPIAMIGISAFDIVMAAQPAPIDAAIIYALVEAGRSRVAVQAFNPITRQPVGNFVLKSHAEFVASIDQPSYICGHVPPQLSSLLHVKIAAPPLNLRRAGYLAELAYARWQRGDVDNAMTLTPIYPP